MSSPDKRLFMEKSSGEISVHIKNPKGLVKTLFQKEISEIEDGKYTIDIKKIRNKRSNQQLRLYWAYVTFIAIELGYITPYMSNGIKKQICDALHKNFKEIYIGMQKISSSKDKRRKIKLEPSTGNLKTKEFGELIINRLLEDFPFLPLPTDKNIDVFIDTYYS